MAPYYAAADAASAPAPPPGPGVDPSPPAKLLGKKTQQKWCFFGGLVGWLVSKGNFPCKMWAKFVGCEFLGCDFFLKLRELAGKGMFSHICGYFRKLQVGERLGNHGCSPNMSCSTYPPREIDNSYMPKGQAACY